MCCYVPGLCCDIPTCPVLLSDAVCVDLLFTCLVLCCPVLLCHVTSRGFLPRVESTWHHLRNESLSMQIFCPYIQRFSSSKPDDVKVCITGGRVHIVNKCTVKTAYNNKEQSQNSRTGTHVWNLSHGLYLFFQLKLWITLCHGD